MVRALSALPLLLLLAGLSAIALATAGCAPGREVFTWRESRETVGHVIDGDTFILASGERIRLLGFDAPNRGKPGYQAAKERLHALVHNRAVTVRREGFGVYGRTLARVYLPDGRSLAQVLRSEASAPKGTVSGGRRPGASGRSAAQPHAPQPPTGKKDASK